MIYPDNFEEKTGFDRIREMLRGQCFSPLGMQEVDKIAFSADIGRIAHLLRQTEEFRQVLLSGEHFPGTNYFDLSETFAMLRIADTFAEPEVLLELKLSLETILAIIAFLGRKRDDGQPKYPSLSELTSDLLIDDDLPSRINAIIDEKAVVRSNASPELAEIRRQMHQLEQQANRRIARIFSEGKKEGWIQKDVELALRNGRQVIPVAVAFKRRIRGFVHDHSSSGQTAFLEPEEVFEINNQIKELEADERREIIRILKAFADHLRPMIPELEKAFRMLGVADLIRAKARLALEMDAQLPRLKEGPMLNWTQARHPLLYLSYKKQNKHVEPMSIRLDSEVRILIISGPNAGGKSVCLKTCGLIQYMLQCGLLVPMLNHSEAGIFTSLFIDIGDEQSLDNDLSTYSSHLLNMKHFLAQCNESSLFLIDEFGAGTEPRIGGAIAESILERLNEKGALGVVTTHYANLKLMAGKHPGISNGSMLFDSKNIRPLYRLKTGIPGSSFAFEIAKSIGLPGELLEKAAHFAGEQDLDFDIQLQNLEARKAELDEKEQQLRHADDFMSGIIDKYEKLRDDLESRKNEILLKARQEAGDILSGANRRIENTIREIREAQAGTEKTREVRKELAAYIREQEEAIEQSPRPLLPRKEKKKKKPVPAAAEVDPTPLQKGDIVRIKGHETQGELIELSGDKAVISTGNIKIRTFVRELEKLKKGSITTVTPKKSARGLFDINEKAASFSPEIDLRGARLDDATKRLQRHLDDAFLLGVPQIRILHGKGDGILRPAIREFLKAVPHVHRIRDEHPDRGGAGVTIVDFS
ncbi:MAG: Smr/MutS family protein [Bacteroidales bacterium]|nr:Smr/MutS family protein [Bacteroidales bacterium]